MQLRKLQALSGILAPAFFFAAVIYTPLGKPGCSHTPVGLAQKLLVAAYLIWIVATGAKMYTITAG
jgi:hypothetical protein